MAFARSLCRFSRSAGTSSYRPGLGLVSAAKPKDVTGELPEVEVSSDPEEFKWVERLLPKQVMPPPPKHESYPTPSGWFPATAESSDYPYFVKRTRFYQYPIRSVILEGGMRKITELKYVFGDIWKFEKDLREYLESQLDEVIYTQVDEFTCKVRVRGEKMDEVCDFLKLKGF